MINDKIAIDMKIKDKIFGLYFIISPQNIVLKNIKTCAKIDNIKNTISFLLMVAGESYIKVL